MSDVARLAIGDWVSIEDTLDMDRDISMHRPVLLDVVVEFLRPVLLRTPPEIIV